MLLAISITWSTAHHIRIRLGCATVDLRADRYFVLLQPPSKRYRVPSTTSFLLERNHGNFVSTALALFVQLILYFGLLSYGSCSYEGLLLLTSDLITNSSDAKSDVATTIMDILCASDQDDRYEKQRPLEEYSATF